MKALVVTSSYPVRPGALGGRFVAGLLRLLAPRGWEFTVVTPAWETGARPFGDAAGWIVPAHAPEPFAPHRLAHRAGILDELARCPWQWWRVPSLVVSLAEAARRLLDRGGYDLVWSHWLLPCGLAARFAAARRATPHLATAHGGDLHLLEQLCRLRPLGAAAQALWKNTHLTAPTPHAARRLERMLPGLGVRVLPLAAGTAPETEEPAPERDDGFLYLGRLEPVKGADRLLEAAARVPGTPVTLAGAGSEASRLASRARALGVPARFPGVLDGGAKRAALRRATALVLPSRRVGGRPEGFPHAAMEALVAGTPVIAPARGALGEHLRAHGAGWVFDDRGSECAIADQLGAVLRFAAAAGRDAGVRQRAGRAGEPFHDVAASQAWDGALRQAARPAA